MTPKPDTVERVARAMCVADGVDPDSYAVYCGAIPGETELAWERRVKAARAAIAEHLASLIENAAEAVLDALSSKDLVAVEGWSETGDHLHEEECVLALVPLFGLSLCRWAESFSKTHYDDLSPGWYSESLDRRVEPTMFLKIPTTDSRSTRDDE